MRLGRACVVLLLLALALPAAAETPAWSGKVLDVLDGDSLIVRRGRNPVEIRLYGIDCPEYRQPYSDQARDFTRKHAAQGKRVRIKSMDVDRHSRVVARVFIDGQELNLALIQAGLAWWYAKYSPRELAYRDAQDAARKIGRGLWADPEPVSPWLWRRVQRANRKKP